MYDCPMEEHGDPEACSKPRTANGNFVYASSMLGMSTVKARARTGQTMGPILIRASVYGVGRSGKAILTDHKPRISFGIPIVNETSAFYHAVR